MPGITWDDVSDRVYEAGLDRGVLYLPDGSLVPWNGLTSVIEQFDKESSAVYYDGMKISDLVVLGDFKATMKAITYPDEFLELEGTVEGDRRGVFFGDQPPQTFGLCYRTHIGTALSGDVNEYKIHILYNVTAIPHEKTYETLKTEPTLSEFEWDIVAVPQEVPGYRPTAHLVLDSRELDPWLLEDLESRLYGEVPAAAMLISMPDLVDFINQWYRLKIIDNGDGSWTAISDRPEVIQLINILEDIYRIMYANVTYIDDVTYKISDTIDISDIPQIKITNNGDGTWTAETEFDELIIITGDQFEILNANAEFLSPVLYRLEDTTEST